MTEAEIGGVQHQAVCGEAAVEAVAEDGAAEAGGETERELRVVFVDTDGAEL